MSRCKEGARLATPARTLECGRLPYRRPPSNLRLPFAGRILSLSVGAVLEVRRRHHSVLGTTDTLTAFPPSTASPTSFPRPLAHQFNFKVDADVEALISEPMAQTRFVTQLEASDDEVLRPVTDAYFKYSMSVAATEELDRKWQGSDARNGICRMSIRRIHHSPIFPQCATLPLPRRHVSTPLNDLIPPRS